MFRLTSRHVVKHLGLGAVVPETKLRFTTAKGSKYDLIGVSRTKRFKSYHAEHGAADQGEKETSDLTVYLEEPGFTKFATQAAVSGPDFHLVMLSQKGLALLGYWRNLKRWDRYFAEVPFSLVPQKGLYPLELWGLNINVHADSSVRYAFAQGWHIGNKITAIDYIKETLS